MANPSTEWQERGFVRRNRFVAPDVGASMLDRVTQIARRAAAGGDVSPAFVTPETQAGYRTRAGAAPSPRPEDLVSKVFRLHRDTVFREFATDPAVVAVAADIVGTDVACFLSQFIFKNPGAWGQPWHQDSFYFPFEPPRPVVGLWLAVTEATLGNGCLQVLPGSHREPVHAHVPDARPGANHGYFEIVDHEMAGARPVPMQPGDVLVFDSHLMHRSTDNTSDGIRAAMVFHYAAAGTVDRSRERFGYTINDWMPVGDPRRRGASRDLGHTTS